MNPSKLAHTVNKGTIQNAEFGNRFGVIFTLDEATLR